MPLITKTRYIGSLQCLKKIYLSYHKPGLAEKSHSSYLVAGRKVGRLARAFFGGGRLVTEDHGNYLDAVETTKRLLKDHSVPVLFEGAFSFGQAFARVDILRRSKTDPATFDLIEVIHDMLVCISCCAYNLSIPDLKESFTFLNLDNRSKQHRVPN